MLVTSVPSSLSNVRKHLGDVNKRIELLHGLGEIRELDMSVKECNNLATAHTDPFLDILGVTTRNINEVGDTSQWGPGDISDYAGSIHASAAMLKESKVAFEHHSDLETRLLEKHQSSDSCQTAASVEEENSREVDGAITLYDRFLGYTHAASHLYVTDKAISAVERMYEDFSKRAPDTAHEPSGGLAKYRGRKKKNTTKKTQKDDINWATALSDLKFAQDALKDTRVGTDQGLWERTSQRRDYLRDRLRIDTDDEFYEKHFGSMNDDYSGWRYNMSTLGDIQKYLTNRSEVLEKKHQDGLFAAAKHSRVSKIAIVDPQRASSSKSKVGNAKSGFGLEKSSLLTKKSTSEDAINYFEKARQGVKYSPDTLGSLTVATVVRNISRLRQDAQDEYHNWVQSQVPLPPSVRGTSELSIDELKSELDKAIDKLRKDRSTMKESVERRREFNQITKIAEEYQNQSSIALKSVVEDLKMEWDCAAKAEAERRASRVSQAELIKSELRTSWTATDYHTFKASIAKKLRPSDFPSKNDQKAYNRRYHEDRETARLYGERILQLQKTLNLIETGGTEQDPRTLNEDGLEMGHSLTELTLSGSDPMNAFEIAATRVMETGNNAPRAHEMGTTSKSRRWADMVDEEDASELDDLMVMPWHKRDKKTTDTNTSSSVISTPNTKKYATWADLFK